MIRIDRTRTPRDLLPKIARLFALSARKILAIEETWRPQDGAPVFTVAGPLPGARLDRVDAGVPVRLGAAAVRRDRRRARFSSSAAARTVERMAPHLTHMGVHDHGFNNVSTYGNLWRLAREGRIERDRLGAALLRARA